jgi:putative membrane protein
MQTLMVGTVALRTSEIAMEKATNTMLKEFAQLEVNEQKTIASILAATPHGAMPPELPAEEQAKVQQLTDMMAGPEFDAAYLQGQMEGHQQLLQIQQTLSGETVATVEAITARLAEQAVTSHLVMLSHINAALTGATPGTTP